MRTTLTLEPDVSQLLERVREERELSLKDAVNSALRLGLQQLDQPRATAGEPYQTPAADSGRLLVPDLACISQVLAFLDEAETLAGQ